MTRDGDTAKSIGPLLTSSLTAQWRDFSELFERLQHKIKSGDVHDVRVAIRRVMAQADLMHEAVHVPSLVDLRKKVKKVLSRMGDVRDAEVQEKLVAELVDAFPALGAYHQRLEGKYRGQKQDAQEWLQGVSFKGFRKQFALALAEVTPHWSEHLASRQRVQALEAIDRAFADVVETRRQLDMTRLDTVHHMRVAFKKFRYMVEVMQPLLPRVGAAQINSMHAFQSLMGDIHDLDVLTADLARYRQRHKRRDKLTLAQDELTHRLLMMTDGFMAASDELFTFWDHSWIPEALPPGDLSGPPLD